LGAKTRAGGLGRTEKQEVGQKREFPATPSRRLIAALETLNAGGIQESQLKTSKKKPEGGTGRNLKLRNRTGA